MLTLPITITINVYVLFHLNAVIVLIIEILRILISIVGSQVVIYLSSLLTKTFPNLLNITYNPNSIFISF